MPYEPLSPDDARVKVYIQARAQGLTPAQAHKKMIEQEYSISDRTIRRWEQHPRIRKAILSAQEKLLGTPEARVSVRTKTVMAYFPQIEAMQPLSPGQMKEVGGALNDISKELGQWKDQKQVTCIVKFIITEDRPNA